ncbi:hypothetical protein IP69_16835 [Bosea sp. AAP35]|nr:hypothetical protein IP69_16835 [Bosea sp. AAP35]
MQGRVEKAAGILALFTALILRSAPQERVSKDAPGGEIQHWSILRDAAARLLRMRADHVAGVSLTAARPPAAAGR